VVAVLQQSTPSGGTVLDIGAHVGTETLMFSRWVGESGKVIAVEADPKTAARLQSNLQLNNLSNVQMIAKAISNHVGTVRFSADVTVTSAVADSAAQSSTVEIPCDTIDHLDQSLGLGRIDLIKIDVEDHEVAVLDGAVQTLRDKSPVWIVEIHSPASLHGCVERFEAAGYRVQNVEPDAAAILASKNPDPAQFHRFHLLARRP
jgi:FkbM family methyltransferase